MLTVFSLFIACQFLMLLLQCPLHDDFIAVPFSLHEAEFLIHMLRHIIALDIAQSNLAVLVLIVWL